MLVCLCVWSGGYNLQDVVFYWTRGNDSVKGLDTLRLAQYSVESYYTSVSQAVYETGAVLTLTHYSPNSRSHVQSESIVSSCVSSQDNTQSLCYILHCVEMCCSSSWRHMFPPFCWWFSPGSRFGSVSPRYQLGPVSVSALTSHSLCLIIIV